MEQARFSLVIGGAYWSPLGDQTPIDSRWSEVYSSVELPHRQMLLAGEATLVPQGPLHHPLAILVWNCAGVGQQTQPTDQERAETEAKVLLVGLTADGTPPAAWQSLPPPKLGSGHNPCLVLRPAAGARICLQPAVPGLQIPVRVLVIPGRDS